MEKKQYDDNEFIIYSPDSLKLITKNSIDILINSIKRYKKIFDIEKFRKVQINYFDDIDKFRDYIYDLRGEKGSLPKYAIGTFDKGMINSYIDPNIDINSTMYQKKLYMASHELFHIMYKELILDSENKNRIVWFDEGMAQLFSGEYDYLLNNKYNEFIDKVLNSTKEIPNMNELKHGTSFKNELYNGYALSLISVKYLYETLGLDEFKKLMHDNDKILDYGNNLIEKIKENI